MYDIIWYWLNFLLNPLRVSPLVGGRWVFRFPFFLRVAATRAVDHWRQISLENGPGSTGRVRVSDPWSGTGRGGASDRQPAADQRERRSESNWFDACRGFKVWRFLRCEGLKVVRCSELWLLWLLFFSCYSCWLFFSCYSCWLFFSCFSCWLYHCYVSLLAFLFLLGQVRSGSVRLRERYVGSASCRRCGACPTGWERQLDVELVQQEKANIEIFQWNWPGTFRANPKREKEGMMRCSATSKQMMSLISTAPPPHPPPRCRFVFLACFSFLLFVFLAFSFLFFLFLFAFSFLVFLACFSFLLFVFLACFFFSMCFSCLHFFPSYSCLLFLFFSSYSCLLFLFFSSYSCLLFLFLFFLLAFLFFYLFFLLVGKRECGDESHVAWLMTTEYTQRCWRPTFAELGRSLIKMFRKPAKPSLQMRGRLVRSQSEAAFGLQHLGKFLVRAKRTFLPSNWQRISACQLARRGNLSGTCMAACGPWARAEIEHGSILFVFLACFFFSFLLILVCFFFSCFSCFSFLLFVFLACFFFSMCFSCLLFFSSYSCLLFLFFSSYSCLLFLFFSSYSCLLFLFLFFLLAFLFFYLFFLLVGKRECGDESHVAWLMTTEYTQRCWRPTFAELGRSLIKMFRKPAKPSLQMRGRLVRSQSEAAFGLQHLGKFLVRAKRTFLPSNWQRISACQLARRGNLSGTCMAACGPWARAEIEHGSILFVFLACFFFSFLLILACFFFSFLLILVCFFFSCFSCLLFFSSICFSCLLFLFYVFFLLAFLSFLFLLAFSFLFFLFLFAFSFLFFLFLFAFSFLVFLACFSFLLFVFLACGETWMWWWVACRMTHDHRVHAEVLETYFCGAGQIFDKDVQKARETKPTNARPPSAFPVRGGIWPPAPGEVFGQSEANLFAK